MPNAETFLKEPLRFFIALVGEPGAGKTKQSISFPKAYVVSMGDSYGLKTVLSDPKNAALQKNLVWHEALDLSSKKDALEMFRVTEKPDELGSIYGVLAHVKELAKAGAIETFVLDGGSFLGDFKGAAIAKGLGVTEADRWSYYRQLKHDLTWFINANVMPLITRHKLNVILTFHVQRVTDEEKEKQTTKDKDWSVRLEGGMRQTISALPRAMIYLHQKVSIIGTEQKVEFKAYCQPVKIPHVGIVPAKNSYNLPAVLDVTDKDLYDILTRTMSNGTAQQKSSNQPTTK